MEEQGIRPFPKRITAKVNAKDGIWTQFANSTFQAHNEYIDCLIYIKLPTKKKGHEQKQ